MKNQKKQGTKTGRPPRQHHDQDGKKLSTRESLIAAALRLTETKSFFEIGIREITREIGMSPASFYSHFSSMEELAVAIVDDTFLVLRPLLMEARQPDSLSKTHGEKTIKSIVEIIDQHPERYRFIITVFDSSVTRIREAFNRSWNKMLDELKSDLSNMKSSNRLDGEALDLATRLMAKATMNFAAELIVRANSKEERQRVIATGSKELRLIYLGALNWKGSIVASL